MPTAGGDEAGCQWVVAGRGAVGGRDLPPAGDAELLAQDVRMSLGRPRRDAEAIADLLVRATCRDQLDDLPLAGRDRRNRALEGLVHHGRDATSACDGPLFTERRIFGELHGASGRGGAAEGGLLASRIG